MAQGGDPTATGRGGRSIWGNNFDDEISDELKHSGAGVKNTHTHTSHNLSLSLSHSLYC